jgi:hypothetical protein
MRIHNGILFSHKNEIMSLAGKWMELESMILMEIRQIQKDNNGVFFSHM